MSNATEFAEWICNIHKQPCHVVYTDFRPTPLQHYVFPMGGSGLYLVVDENEQFMEGNFLKLQDTFNKQSSVDSNSKGSGRIAKNGNSSGGSDIYKIIKVRDVAEDNGEEAAKMSFGMLFPLRCIQPIEIVIDICPKESSSEEVDCTIWLDKYEDGLESATVAKCNHRFHADCIK